MKKNSVKKETWEDWEQTCEKLKKYETTLKRVTKSCCIRLNTTER